MLDHPFFNPDIVPSRLLGEPAEYDVFISYRRKEPDKSIALALYTAFTEDGLLVFLDDKSLSNGCDWLEGTTHIMIIIMYVYYLAYFITNYSLFEFSSLTI